jgi:CBS domain-containing protein
MHDLKVSDVMSRRVHHVSPRLGVLDLDGELASRRISGAPVLDRAGQVLGIVSRSDLDGALARERSKAAAVAGYYVDPEEAEAPPVDPTGAALERLRALTVQDIMTKEVISVPPGASIVHAAGLMRSRRIHRVLVLKDGALVGLLSSLDIVGAVAALA